MCPNSDEVTRQEKKREKKESIIVIIPARVCQCVSLDFASISQFEGVNGSVCMLRFFR